MLLKLSLVAVVLAALHSYIGPMYSAAAIALLLITLVARVLVGYFLKVKVRPATRAQWLCCAVLCWRFAVFSFFYGIFSYSPVREPKLIFRCDASIRSANVSRRPLPPRASQASPISSTQLKAAT
jgi:hypothetical protein